MSQISILMSFYKSFPTSLIAISRTSGLHPSTFPCTSVANGWMHWKGKNNVHSLNNNTESVLIKCTRYMRLNNKKAMKLIIWFTTPTHTYWNGAAWLILSLFKINLCISIKIDFLWVYECPFTSVITIRVSIIGTITIRVASWSQMRFEEWLTSDGLMEWVTLDW